MRIREKKVKKVYIIYDLRYVKCIDKRKNDIPVKDFNLLKYTFKGMVWQIGKALKRGTVSEKESKTSSYSDCRSTGSVYYLAVGYLHIILLSSATWGQSSCFLLLYLQNTQSCPKELR